MSQPAPPLPKLTPKQQLALTSLLAGGSITEAARAATVRRETVSRWVHGDPEFIAEMNRRRAELWDGSMDELRSLLPDAVGALRDSLAPTSASSARLRAASLLLRTLGVGGETHTPLSRHAAPRTADGVVAAWEDEERRRREAEELQRMLAPVLSFGSG